MSEAIRAYRISLWLFHAGLIMIGLYFGRIVINGGSPVTPELYGPAVYSIPALVWAAGQVGAHGLVILGLAVWGRLGRAMVLIGAIIGGIFHSFLAYFGALASQGTLVHAASMFVTVPACVLTIAFVRWSSRYG